MFEPTLLRDLRLSKGRGLRTALTILVILVTATVAACGPGSPQATPSPTGPTPTVTVPFEMPVTISMTGRFDDQTLAILDEQIALFEDENPDIKVAIVDAPEDEAERVETFISQLRGGDTSNDIYVLDATLLPALNANGWLALLDEYVEAQGIGIGNFLPATIQGSTIDGRLVALPWLADGGLLYFRQDLLEKHGYQPPDTWVDLEQIALDVKAKEGLPYGFVWQGAAYESLTCNTLEFVWVHGGDVLDEDGNPIFDSVETRAALKQMSDFIALGVSPPEVATYQEEATLSAFQSGDAVLMRNWSYAWDRLNGADSPQAGRVGLAPLPTSCMGGQNLALSAHSLHPDQAFRFMAFLVDYPQQLQLARQGGQPPALETAYQDAELLTEAPVFRNLHAALSVTRPRPQSPAYLEVSEAIYTEVNKMLQGEQDASSAASKAQSRIEGILP